MDSELAALAAAGATTLVSLMVTDSWTHAREQVRRFFARTGSSVAMAELDDTRNRLLTGDAATDGPDSREVAVQLRVHLQQLVETGSVTGDDLRRLLTSLQRIGDASATRPGTVHNDITGGVQHGPVIQSGRITGLTVHGHQSSG